MICPSCRAEMRAVTAWEPDSAWVCVLCSVWVGVDRGIPDEVAALTDRIANLKGDRELAHEFDGSPLVYAYRARIDRDLADAQRRLAILTAGARPQLVQPGG